MRVLVNGASISAQPQGWQHHLQKSLACELTNLSIPGTGYDYVHDATIAELAKQPYDLVLIMWPAIAIRTDWRVDDIAQFGSDGYTSAYYAKDNPAIDPDWIMGGGHVLDESLDVPVERRSRISRLFADYYSVVKPPQLIRQSLLRIITLQSVLKSLNIPYAFMMPAPTRPFPRFMHLHEMIDPAGFFDQEHLMPYCVRHNLIDPRDPLNPTDVDYPSEAGHRAFAELLLQHLRDRSYVQK
jgi:hypothetical protein